MLFSSIWPIERTLLGATTPCQSEPGSNDNEGMLYNPQNSSITWTSPSDCLVSYPGIDIALVQFVGPQSNAANVS